MATRLFGSLCLSDIPEGQIKKVTCKDGRERLYLNITIFEKREPLSFDGGKTTYTHSVSCAPRKEERAEGVNYYIGDLRQWNDQPQAAAVPTPEEINAAPAAEIDQLPF